MLRNTEAVTEFNCASKLNCIKMFDKFWTPDSFRQKLDKLTLCKGTSRREAGHKLQLLKHWRRYHGASNIEHKMVSSLLQRYLKLVSSLVWRMPWKHAHGIMWSLGHLPSAVVANGRGQMTTWSHYTVCTSASWSRSRQSGMTARLKSAHSGATKQYPSGIQPSNLCQSKKRKKNKTM